MTAKIPPKPEKPAKPSKDTVYIDVDDEITAIIDKVEAAKYKIVALVLPKRATTLQSVVNMRLLKRNADKADKSVVLITSEAALLPLAGAAGLHVAKNLQSKPIIPPSPLDQKDLPGELDAIDSEVESDVGETKLDHHRSIGELAAAGAMDEADTISLDDEPEATPASKVSSTSKKSKLSVPNFDRFRTMMGLGIAGLIALIIFIILALFVLPKATIAIQTTSTPLAANIELKASGSARTLDEEQGIIPSESKTSKQLGSEQVAATGQQNNGDKATGNVTMTSQKCAPNIGQPADVSAGTGMSSNGLTFISQSSASFSYDSASGSCVNYKANAIPIKSQAAGAKYNVSGATFSVFGRSDVSASGSASGGTDDIKTVVSQQDVDGAKQKITSKNSDDFTKKFQKDLEDEGYYVLTSTLKLTEPKTTATPNVGEEATTVNVTTQINYSVMVVKKDDLKKAILHELNKQVDAKKQKISSSDVVADASISVQNQTSPTNAKLVIDENTTAIPIIDITHVKQQAAGHKVGDIRAFISGIPGVEKVDVKLSPFWVSKAPKQSKITVKIEQIKSKTDGQNP